MAFSRILMINGQFHRDLRDKINIKPNQIWQGQDDAHTLIIIARSTVLPYLIGLQFSIFSTLSMCTDYMLSIKQFQSPRTIRLMHFLPTDALPTVPFAYGRFA